MRKENPTWFNEHTPGYEETREIQKELILVRKARIIIAERKKREESLVPWFKKVLLHLGLSKYSRRLRKIQELLHNAESRIMSTAHHLFVTKCNPLGLENPDPEGFRKFNNFCLGVGSVDPESGAEIEVMTMFWGKSMLYPQQQWC